MKSSCPNSCISRAMFVSSGTPSSHLINTPLVNSSAIYLLFLTSRRGGFVDQFDLFYQSGTVVVYNLGQPINLGAGLSAGLPTANVEFENDATVAVGYNQEVVSEYVGAFIAVFCYCLNERRRTFSNRIEEHSLEIRHADTLGGFD